MSSLQVAVVGAGIGGLATASALSHRGFDVQVYEQARQLGEVGAGVALGSNSIRLLERLGLEGPLRDYGPRWTQWRFNAADGRVLTNQEMDGRVVGMYRPDLIAMLADSLPKGAVSTGKRSVGFRQDSDRAIVEFADGSRARGRSGGRGRRYPFGASVPRRGAHGPRVLREHRLPRHDPGRSGPGLPGHGVEHVDGRRQAFPGLHLAWRSSHQLRGLRPQ